MFQLTKAEAEVLRSQIATSNEGSGGRRYAPYVFTEQGVAMLSGVQLELDIGARLSEHDDQLRQIFEALRHLIDPPAPPRRPIGFRIRNSEK
jgi:hypothetical protein